MTLNLNAIEFNLQEKKEFFNSFSSLYTSGMPVIDVFKSIKNSSQNEKIKALCNFIEKQISKGKTLDEAFSKCSNALGAAYSSLISAGEESGKLEHILSNICSNITKQQEIKSNLISALLYPGLMFFMALSVALLFQFIVIPSFKSVSDYSLDFNIKTLFITGILKIILVFIVLFALCFYICKSPDILRKMRNFLSSIWIINGILKNYYFSNFFYIMALSYDAGITPAKSVMLANSVIGIDKINKLIKKSEKMIEQGSTIAHSLGITGVFSGFAISQVASGEEAGKLEKMLVIVAKDYESKMDLTIKAMMKLIGPVILIIVGIIVAVIAARGYSEYYNAIYSMF